MKILVLSIILFAAQSIFIQNAFCDGDCLENFFQETISEKTLGEDFTFVSVNGDQIAYLEDQNNLIVFNWKDKSKQTLRLPCRLFPPGDNLHIAFSSKYLCLSSISNYFLFCQELKEPNSQIIQKPFLAENLKVIDDFLFYRDGEKPESILSCMNLKTAEEIWSVSSFGAGAMYKNFIIENNFAFEGTGKVSLDTGKYEWFYEYEKGKFEKKPVIMDRKIIENNFYTFAWYVYDKKHEIYQFSKDSGKVNWIVNLPIYNSSPYPKLLGTKNFLFLKDKDFIFCLDKNSGEIIWEKQFEEPDLRNSYIKDIEILGDNLFVQTSFRLDALNIFDGKSKWSQGIINVNNYKIILLKEKLIYISDNSTVIKVVDPFTGKILEEKKINFFKNLFSGNKRGGLRDDAIDVYDNKLFFRTPWNSLIGLSLDCPSQKLDPGGDLDKK